MANPTKDELNYIGAFMAHFCFNEGILWADPIKNRSDGFKVEGDVISIDFIKNKIIGNEFCKFLKKEFSIDATFDKDAKKLTLKNISDDTFNRLLKTAPETWTGALNNLVTNISTNVFITVQVGDESRIQNPKSKVKATASGVHKLDDISTEIFNALNPKGTEEFNKARIMYNPARNNVPAYMTIRLAGGDNDADFRNILTSLKITDLNIDNNSPFIMMDLGNFTEDNIKSLLSQLKQMQKKQSDSTQHITQLLSLTPVVSNVSNSINQDNSLSDASLTDDSKLNPLVTNITITPVRQKIIASADLPPHVKAASKPTKSKPFPNFTEFKEIFTGYKRDDKLIPLTGYSFTFAEKPDGGYTVTSVDKDNKPLHKLEISSEKVVSASFVKSEDKKKMELLAHEMITAYIAAGNDLTAKLKIDCDDPEMRKIFRNVAKTYLLIVADNPEDISDEISLEPNNDENDNPNPAI